MKWISTHNHDWTSILDGFADPYKLAARAASYDMDSLALTNHGNISGIPTFFKACAKANIKPIAGVEFYISDIDSQIKDKGNGNSHLVVLAKNKTGWDKLIKAVSASNHPDNFYRKPRLDIDRLSQYCGDFISFSGHPGSNLAKVIMHPDCYNARSVEEAASFVLPNAEADACRLALRMQDIFGKGNFFIEIQLIDQDRLHISVVLADILRRISKKTGIPCVATGDTHYVNKEDAVDQRVLLCSSLRTTLGAVDNKMNSDEGFPLSGFFQSNNYHLPTQDRIAELHSGYDEEIYNSVLISNMCESYDISSQPRLPKFKCDNEIEYLTELCRIGWRTRLAHVPKEDRSVYADRVRLELKIINDANLSGYFLIVQDYINWAKKRMLVGPGRGSAGGSLVAYLTGITEIDPVEYGLMFSRFYNQSRNTPEHITFDECKYIDFVKGG